MAWMYAQQEEWNFARTLSESYNTSQQVIPKANAGLLTQNDLYQRRIEVS